ncbi:tryptophan halogenase family protein [Sphingomonas sp. CROZ-RG-20F-R02-07]|uniref:tryptophan halogenase family protein n=1 Tax=Sphingomonas sp. CROZ-RG-20F-R02-07 TaxID=2914832 RepID=UPI001F5AFE58|nr:tryptophan halogenase family protein [Sphingomonas sp. CROZ-RG-20F-R02-07]
MRTGALGTVLVAGGGITAWCAAAALRRRAPFLDVTLLATPVSPDALADRIACTLPSLLGFHGDLGIGEGDGIARTGAGYRLGTRFSGWAEGLADYAHAYGRYGRPFGPTSFHLHWLRAARTGAAGPFDGYSPAAALARADRFVPATPDTPFADHEYGLTLDPPRYHAMMRAFALHVGVREIAGEIADVRVDARGFVAAVTLADGRAVGAQLFVDATGPEARLRGALDAARDDWSRWLPCDRVLLADGPAAAPPVLTPVMAHPAGWRWTSGQQSGFGYASGHLGDAAAARVLRNACGQAPDAPIRIRPGTRPEPWRGNVVAIGDAATEMEPLEWCNLHLALSAIDRLVTMLPGAVPTPVEAADFNRQSLAEANRVRDFLAMHWRTAQRRDPLWRAVAAAEPPASLAHTLAQWTERGRLPFHEEETFARDAWAAVLIGQGCLPRRLDPLIDAVPAASADAAMAALAADIAAALPHLPTHAAFRAAQARYLTR